MVFQKGMEESARVTKQAKKAGACVTLFVIDFTIFLPELDYIRDLNWTEKLRVGILWV